MKWCNGQEYLNSIYIEAVILGTVEKTGVPPFCQWTVKLTIGSTKTGVEPM